MTKKLSEYNWNVDVDTRVRNMKELLNSTGPGFCLAKFRQVTMHLALGKVHSCHHPYAHKIDPEEVKSDPSLLFNTPVLKAAREEMVNGNRPSECNYCWRVEDADEKNVSDRHFKSSEFWAINDHDEIISQSPKETFYPTYLEVSFNNACNLKCVYCGPDYSTKWAEEIKQKGQIVLLTDTDKSYIHNNFNQKAVIKNREYNPYIEAFWKWWPEIYSNLKVFRITGGEPLMSKDTFKSLDWFIDNPNPNLELCINSNFSVEEKLWKKFLQKIDYLNKNNNLKNITIYTSVESWEERAEYIRSGLNFNLLLDRIDQCLELGIRVDIMAAFNILSITSYQQLLEWVLSRKKKYNKNKTIFAIDTAYVRGPDHLDAIYADDELLSYLKKTCEYVFENLETSDVKGFNYYEYEKIWRMYNTLIKSQLDEKIKSVCRAKLFDYINQIDKRRNFNFLLTFPEYKNFYMVCEQSKNEMVKRNKDEKSSSDRMQS